MAFLIDDSDLSINAENKELRKVIKGIFSRIPVRYSLPLVLHYVENMSLIEIKEVLGIPVSTIKWRLYQGRILFKKYAGDHLCSKYIII